MTSATHSALLGASERLRDHAMTLWEAGPERRARALGKAFAVLAEALELTQRGKLQRDTRLGGFVDASAGLELRGGEG